MIVVLIIVVVIMGFGYDISILCFVIFVFIIGGEMVEGYVLFGYIFENVLVIG